MRQIANGEPPIGAAPAVTPAPVAPASRDAVTRIAELKRDPAYLDVRHPWHGQAVAAVTRAYEAAYPDPDKPPAAPTPREAAVAAAERRIRELTESEAYQERDHPAHGDAVAGVGEAYAVLHPETPES